MAAAGARDPGAIGHLRGWLTTVAGRISLDMPWARKARREVYPGSWLPEPVVNDPAGDGPEHAAVLADSIGTALLVVLETLSPAERLSFRSMLFGMQMRPAPPSATKRRAERPGPPDRNYPAIHRAGV